MFADSLMLRYYNDLSCVNIWERKLKFDSCIVFNDRNFPKQNFLMFTFIADEVVIKKKYLKNIMRKNNILQLYCKNNLQTLRYFAHSCPSVLRFCTSVSLCLSFDPCSVKPVRHKQYCFTQVGLTAGWFSSLASCSPRLSLCLSHIPSLCLAACIHMNGLRLFPFMLLVPTERS